MSRFSGAFIAFIAAFLVSSVLFSMTANAEISLLSEVGASLLWLVEGLGQ